MALSFKFKQLILLNFIILFCNGLTENYKTEFVESVIEKVLNLSNKHLKNVNSAEKEEILKRIEYQLLKSAEHFGFKRDKYVELIMDGLKIIANNRSQTLRLERVAPASSALRNDIDHISKADKARELFQKIIKITEKGVTESGDDKQKIVENIKKRIYDIGQETDLKHNKIKKYTDLITRGMEIIIKGVPGDTSKRRTELELVNNNILSNLEEYVINRNDNEEEDNKIHHKLHDESISKLEYDYPTEMTIHNNEELKTAISLDDVYRKTCTEIRSLNEFVCKDKQLTLPFLKICNGVTDCPDGSDEGDCINQAMKLLQRATGIVSSIEVLLQSRNKSVNNVFLLTQNTILNDIMQRQIRFLNKSKYINLNLLELNDAFAFKRKLNEVAEVINALSIALENYFCVQFMNRNRTEQDARKSFGINRDTDDLDELTHITHDRVSLKHCTCNGSFCADLNCIKACKRVCWHRNNLGKWICQAVDENMGVSLDLVCDGKLDCYDETDETACDAGSSNGKFEANEIFDSVLKLISKKSRMTDSPKVNNKLFTMGDTVLKLQNAAMKPKIDKVLLKDIRDKMFALLQSIYVDTLDKAYSIEELEDTHVFLLTVNKRVMSALKRTHTGNERIIPAHGCYCRKGRCAATTCTSGCNRTCAMEPKLTKYWCKGITNNNNSIPIDAICNGTPNCPRNDDEAKCSTDVCRKHHLILLRHHIRDVGEKQKGTALGEALLSWKAKVTSTLIIAEKKHRPTPVSLRDIVADMLYDLVMLYASLENSRRTTQRYNGNVFKEIHKISQRLIESLKTCTK